MTISLKHSFNSTVADGDDSSLVQPSNWNEEHVSLFAASGTGAVTRTLDAKIRETVSVTDFGAVADWNGTTGTDNTAFFTAAVNALGANGGGTLLIPPGEYKGNLLINHSNIVVSGYGASIGFKTSEALSIWATLGTGNLAPFLGFNSSTETPNNVAPGATFYDLNSTTRGSNVINLGSVTGIVKGDFLVIISQEVPSGSTTTTNFVPLYHQIVKVVSVSGSNVTVNEPIEITIAGADPYSFAIKWDMVENISIEGLTVANLYGAAYCCSLGGAYNTRLKNVVFNPESAWGAFATSRKITFDGCVINNSYSGFSNGRMCDEVAVLNSTVKCSDTALFTSEKYFYFCEENTKRFRIDNCLGINAGLRFYIGSQYSDYTISNSKFEMLTPGHSAFILTTFTSSNIKSVNTVFSSYGGQTVAPYDQQPSATVAIAYSTATITFNGCTVQQLGTGIETGLNYGTTSASVPFIIPIISTSGTWTPTIYGSSTTGTTTYTTQNGSYTRIGNVVTASFSVTWSSATGTGSVVVDSLPFSLGTINYGTYTVFDASSVAFAAIPIASTSRLITTQAIVASVSISGVITYQI